MFILSKGDYHPEMTTLYYPFDWARSLFCKNIKHVFDICVVHIYLLYIHVLSTSNELSNTEEFNFPWSYPYSIYSQGEDRITNEIAMKKIGNATQSLLCPKYAFCSISYLTLNLIWVYAGNMGRGRIVRHTYMESCYPSETRQHTQQRQPWRKRKITEGSLKTHVNE